MPQIRCRELRYRIFVRRDAEVPAFGPDEIPRRCRLRGVDQPQITRGMRSGASIAPGAAEASSRNSAIKWA